MPNLTLSMIVKNEEKYLRECLESVKGIVDEIVLVDTGSVDKTIDIAKEFGAKIYNFSWINDFSAARNYSLQKSTGNWILYLDADERLAQKSIPELKKIIQSNKKMGIFCNVVSHDTTNGAPNSMRYARLFKRSKDIEFRGRVHEQIIYSLEERGYKLKSSNIEIDHIGYDVSKDLLQEKADRNLSYLLLDYKDHPNMYNTFQLAQTYSVLGDRDEAVKYFRIVSQMENIPFFYKAHSYRFIASYELNNGNAELALEYALKGKRFDEKQPLLNMVTSKIYMSLENYPEALKYCDKALEVNYAREEKDFEIFLDSKTLIYLGLQIAALAKDSSSFNFYFDELKKQYVEEAETNKYVNVVKLLFNKEGLTQDYLNMFSEFVDKSNLDFFIYLIENQSDAQLQLTLYQKLREKFDSEVNLLNSFGQFLTAVGYDEEAAEVFEKSINTELKDPSIVFFLISIYVKLGQVNKIMTYVEIADNKFGHVPVIAEKLTLLKNQLLALNLNEN